MLNKKLFRFIVFWVCVVVSIITLDSSTQYFQFLFLLPLLYGILFLIVPQFINGFSLRTPGFLILNIVMMIRYIWLPLALKFGEYHRDGVLQISSSMNFAIFLMVIELITIGITISVFSKSYNLIKVKNKTLELEPYEKSQKNFVLFIVLVILVLLILTDPSTLKTFSFINIQEDFSLGSNANASTWSILAITWFRILFPIFWIKQCKSMFNKTNLIIWPYIATIIPVLSLLFFSGMSRSSILIPGLALALILGRTFPAQRTKMYSIIILTALFSLTVLTIYKSFGTTSTSEGVNLIDFKWLSNYLEAYFGGVHNVSIAIDAKNTFENSISVNTLLSDLFRSWMGIGEIFRANLSTSEYFNIEFYGGYVAFDQVVPTIGSAYMLFGLPGVMIFTIFIVWLVCKFEQKYKHVNSIELAYLYGFTAVQSAFNLPGNLVILCSFLLNTFIPLLIIFKLNQLIVSKRKLKKE
ncbi:hypothetical protein CJ195_11305 [Bacillus sp. UMB0899]|nr:hypothetical protein CJ195_11305 [Bacillus sp. UMB0899]